MQASNNRLATTASRPLWQRALSPTRLNKVLGWGSVAGLLSIASCGGGGDVSLASLATPTVTSTAVPTATNTATPTNTPTATNTATPIPTDTPTPTYTPTATNTPVPAMQLSLLAGNVDGPGNLDGIPGAFSAPAAVVSDGAGRVFVADSSNHTIRLINMATGAVSTLAGTAGSSGSANGTGSAARFNSPRGISYSAPDGIYTQGRLFVADSSNRTIRQIDVASQAVTTLAGTAGSLGSADGVGSAARFDNLHHISYSAPDTTYPQGRLFVADATHHTIRQIDVATQAVTTAVGQAGKRGFIPGALPGVLNTPLGVQATPNGLFITMQNGVVQVAPLP